MMLAISAMDPVLAGIFFLIATILFVLAAINVASRIGLVALGLAFCAAVWCWQAFAAAG
jgi:hypothetical protein